MSNWHVGQRVVCVEADGDLLVKDKVYTVLYLGTVCGCYTDTMITVDCDPEENGRCSNCGTAYRVGAWRNYRFRPLDSLSEQMDRIETEGAPTQEPQPEFA